MHLVMFDVDGTLVNSMKFSETLYRRAIEDVLEIECPEDWEGISHITATGILAEVYMKAKEEELTQKDFDKVRDHFLDLVMDKLVDHPEECVAIAGGVELINALKSNDNYMVAIATGDWGPSACFKLSSAGYDISRLVIASSDDDFDRMEIMLKSRERAEELLEDGQGFESVTYLGDALWDKLASEGLGWDFIGVGEMVKDAENHVSDLTSVQNMLKG